MENKIESKAEDSLNTFLDEQSPKAQESVETTNAQESSEPEMIVPEMDDDFQPEISDVSPEENAAKYGIKPKDGEVPDGTILTIESFEFGKPKTKELDNGVLKPVPPRITKNAGAAYYEAKLKVKFTINNWVEYIPSIRYWVNDNKINPKPSIDRNGHSKISQLWRLATTAIAKTKGMDLPLQNSFFNEKPTVIPKTGTEKQFTEFQNSLSDAAILKFLEGKQVKIKVSRGVYNGSNWYRHDIDEILM